MRSLPLVLLLALGCAGTTYTKPEYTQAEWREHWMYCNARSDTGYAIHPLIAIAKSVIANRRFKACLAELGWSVLEEDS